MREVPFDIPPIREALQWNIANNNDRALRWVIEQLETAALAKRRVPDNVVALSLGTDVDRSTLEIEYRMNHMKR